MRARLTIAAKSAVSFALVALVVSIVDLREVFAVLRSADLFLLSVAVALTVGDRLLMAAKWLPLLRVQLPEARAIRVVRAYFASSFASLFLPASVGGDVLRTIGLGRDRHAVVEVGVSVIFERLLGMVGSGLVALLAVGVALRADVSVRFVVPWALACAGLGLAAALPPLSRKARKAAGAILDRFEGRRWTGILSRFRVAYSVYRRHTRVILLVGILSLLEQLVPVLVFWAAAASLRLDVLPDSLLVAVPLTLFAARLPISVAGIGIVEGGLIYLLGLFGVPAAEALSLALAARLAEVVALLPGALWWRELAGAGDEGVTIHEASSERAGRWRGP